MVELMLDLLVGFAGEFSDWSDASKKLRKLLDNEQTTTQEVK